MNKICQSCPRYDASYVFAPGESWYTSHRCPGSACETFTGCVRRPWNPLAPVLGLAYNVDTEQWEEIKKEVK